MAYQQAASRMAPGAALDDLTARVRDALRLVRANVPAMSEPESQLLSDFARGRNLVTLCKLFGISERAFREADALAVVEAMRAHVFARRRHRTRGLSSVLAAICEETASNGPADEAALAFIVTPSPATYERAVETHLRQETATRLVLDALHSTDLHAAPSLARVS